MALDLLVLAGRLSTLFHTSQVGRCSGLGLNLFLQIFCMVYGACLHKAERWQHANRSVSIAGYAGVE